MNELDNYLLSLKFTDGEPSQIKTTFIEVTCKCGAEYSTRVGLFRDEPVSDESINESKAYCPICKIGIKNASSATMYEGNGFAIKFLGGNFIKE